MADGKSKEMCFSTLKRFARDVDDGLKSLQKDINLDFNDISRRRRQDLPGNHSKAVEFLVHSKRDVKQIRLETKKVLEDYKLRSTNIDTISCLMDQMLIIQSERLAKVESFIERYGYVKPAVRSNESSIEQDDTEEPDSVVETGTRLLNSSGGNEHDGAHEDGSEEQFLENAIKDQENSIGTPPASTCKPIVEDVSRTPKLEDLQLSEHTIFMLQKKSEKAAADSATDSLTKSQNYDESVASATKTNRSNIAMRNHVLVERNLPGTPEFPCLLTTQEFKSLKLCTRDTEADFAPENCQGRRNSDEIEITDRRKEIKSPEAPILLTPGFKFRGYVAEELKTSPDLKNSKRALFDTPPLPELTTCVFDASVSYDHNKENTTVYDSEPEPYLPTHSFRSAKATDHGNDSLHLPTRPSLQSTQSSLFDPQSPTIPNLPSQRTRSVGMDCQPPTLKSLSMPQAQKEPEIDSAFLHKSYSNLSSTPSPPKLNAYKFMNKL